MKKMFFFRDVSAQHVKVSHGGFVGLPSITGVTGLNRNFAIQLAAALGLAPHDIQPSGALLAFGGYLLHEGYKKGFKPGKAVYESIPAAWASFTAHIALEVEAVSPAAQEKLAGAALAGLAADLLGGMSLCKGSLRNVKKPVPLEHPSLARFGSDRERVLNMLPSDSFVIKDCSYLVSDMRVEGVPLMEGLVASTLRHSQRPLRYRTFFEDESRQVQEWRLAPVMHGLLTLEEVASGKSTRPDSNGVMEASRFASPTFTLTRLQKAPSLRLGYRQDLDAGVDNPPMMAFWREHRLPNGYFCHAE